MYIPPLSASGTRHSSQSRLSGLSTKRRRVDIRPVGSEESTWPDTTRWLSMLSPQRARTGGTGKGASSHASRIGSQVKAKYLTSSGVQLETGHQTESLPQFECLLVPMNSALMVKLERKARPGRPSLSRGIIDERLLEMIIQSIEPELSIYLDGF